MNLKDKFFGCLKDGRTDCIPNMEMGIWPETIDRWHKEGLPYWVENQFHLFDHLGLDKSFNRDWLPINNELYPHAVETVTEEGDGWKIYENDAGLRFKRSNTMASIPQYLRFPVETREDYERLRSRLNPDDPGRYSEDYDLEIMGRKQRGEVIGANYYGLFGFLRNLMGFENLAVAYYDNPELVRLMIRDHVDFGKRVFKRALARRDIDYVQIWEDMAYKHATIISPAFIRKYMLDGYREVVQVLRDGGVKIIYVDSDGHVEELLPILLEAGIDGVVPCEIAAGSDPVLLKEQHPGAVLMGGVDKRVLAADGREGARRELNRLRPVMRKGKYIPFIDHIIPPDISYDTFLYYIDLKDKLLADLGAKI